mgnify:FL=1
MNTNEVCMAEIGVGVSLGRGTKTWQYSTICDDVVTGENCVIGSCAWIGRGVRMGDNVRIQHGAFIPNGTVIGHRVFIGPNVSLTDDRYPRAGNVDYDALPPILEDDCALGAGVVVLPGVRIGKGVMVGAGAVVTQDVPALAVVVGCPAQPTINRGA